MQLEADGAAARGVSSDLGLRAIARLRAQLRPMHAEIGPLSAYQVSIATEFAERPVVCPPRPVVTDDTGARWRLERLVYQGRYCQLHQCRPDEPSAERPADYLVKLLRKSYEDAEPHASMFQREAWLGATISDPHLVPVLAQQVEQSPRLLIMPRLPGACLAQVISAARSIAIPHALWIARQIATALQTLHWAGWVHGDVKPANIQVAPNGHATLLDFGNARPMGEPADAPNWRFAGTVEYSAPEAFAAGNPLGPTSDLYSLGVTLFEMIAGTHPFADLSEPEVIRAHCQMTPIELSALVPHVPAAVASLVRQLLAKHPLRRPSSAQELISRLMDLELRTIAARM